MPFLVRTLRSAARVSLAGALALFTLLAIILVSNTAHAQNAAAPGPNSDPTYQALRNLALGSEAVSVSNFELKREAGTFHLRSGTVCFVAPVAGKVTGAVFTGDGNFILNPPASEQSMLKLLTKENEFSENFSQMALRFTDSTYDDIKRGGSVVSSGCDAAPLKDSQHTTRHKLKENLDSRVLEDLLSSQPGGLFVAFIHGKPFNEVRLVAIALEQLLELVSGNTRKKARIGDLVAIQMQDRQHRAVAHRIEKLVGVPSGGQRAGLRLAVADHAGDDQIGVVERGAVGMRQGVAQLAAFMNRTRRLRRDMAGDAAGKAELLEQAPHPFLVLRNVRVNLAIGALHISVSHQGRTAVSRPDDVDHVQVLSS